MRSAEEEAIKAFASRILLTLPLEFRYVHGLSGPLSEVSEKVYALPERYAKRFRRSSRLANIDVRMGEKYKWGAGTGEQLQRICN
ncbi:MAG: hypothetical protein QXK88_08440 [Desulfurococcaceae archaeon]